jgi:small GTP-binding protein
MIQGRVVAIGDSSVGKTCLVSRLMEDRFDLNESMTVGANWQLYVQDFNSDRVELQIWDTAGQEKFRSLGPLYYRSAVGALVVFDITNRESFDHLELWIKAFTEVAGNEVRIVIAANKCDLDDRRKVSAKEAIEWGRSRGWMVYETSAATGENVQAAFRALAEAVLARRQQQAERIAGNLPTSESKCC